MLRLHDLAVIVAPGAAPTFQAETK